MVEICEMQCAHYFWAKSKIFLDSRQRLCEIKIEKSIMLFSAILQNNRIEDIEWKYVIHF